MRRIGHTQKAGRRIGKKSYFLFLMLAIFLLKHGYSQISDPAYNELMWSDEDPDSELTEVPEKWIGESAVILYVSEQYSYKKKSMSSFVTEEYAIRQRLKILDETALAFYSEWSMSDLTNKWLNRDQEFAGMKIIKSDGSTYIISENDLVKVENPVESQNGVGAYSKIAIPDLAVGDIIDYYYLSKKNYAKEAGNDVFADFNPQYVLLAGPVPVLKGKLSITPERLAYLNVKYLNGIEAPAVTGDKIKTYLFEYNNVEKMAEEQMIFPLREYPAILFQIVITNQYSVESSLNILGEKDIAKTTITREDLFELLLKLTDEDRMVQYGRAMYNRSRKMIKSMGKINKPGYTEMNEVYYQMRHYLNFNEINYYGQELSMSYFVDQYDFIMAYAAILNDLKIPFELGLTISRAYGDLSDVVVKDHLTPVIRFKGDYPIYITYPHTSSIFGVTDVLLEGSLFYYIDPLSRTKELFIDTIPVSKPDNNVEFDSIFVGVAANDIGNLSIENKHYCYGNTKGFYQEFFMTPLEIYNDELKNTPLSLDIKPKQITEELEMIESFLADATDYSQYMRKVFQDFQKQSLADDNLVIDSLYVTETGRMQPETPLIYSYHGKVTNGIKQAGKYTIIELGRLIGKNKDFTSKELDRKSDIYLDAPRKISWSLVFTIPDGYVLKKYENLVYDVSNEAGSFVSDVELDDKLLIVNVSKTYFKNYYPNSEWGEILEFLDAAVDFTQQQILIEKVN